jgi:tRNA1Val (adenine37-N6)-methyltransferase
MGNSWFQFQKFRVNQDRCAMKISTDAILLGSLVKSANSSKILDIGTGTGVIALMLAQRFPDADVTAIEIDEDAAMQAEENFRESPFFERMTLHQGPVQDFRKEEKFDLIVSNPPFFPDHLKSTDSKRNRALHTDELSFGELIENAVRLLSEEGAFWVILPPRQMRDLEDLAKQSGLFFFEKVQVRDNLQKPIYREIAGFSMSHTTMTEVQLTLKDEQLTYTSAYRSLLSGFLLGY